MSRDLPKPELADREKEFFTKNTPSTAEQLLYYTELQEFSKQIEVDIEKLRGLDQKQILRMIISRVYYFVTIRNNYSLFDHSMAIYDDLLDVSIFTTLCMFLYDTRRIKGLSLRKFIYYHSPRRYGTKGAEYYFNYDECMRMRDRPANKSILYEDTNLRKYRERLLSAREVYNDSSEWSAIRKVSEHEWELYFLLEDADDEIRDTAKRIRNLYNGIYDARKSSVDDPQAAYHKFMGKLKKIQYERVLRLNRFFIEHIRKDPVCYGINLYLFERMSSLYSLTNEVNRLLKCQSEDERDDILLKSVILKDIHFPKLYEYFSGLENNDRIWLYAKAFPLLMRDLVQSSRLVIDKFVDDGLFGKDWESLFLEVINELAETVLYDPETIDYSVTPESQAMFIEVISAPVKIEIVPLMQAASYFRGADTEEEM